MLKHCHNSSDRTRSSKRSFTSDSSSLNSSSASSNCDSSFVGSETSTNSFVLQNPLHSTLDSRDSRRSSYSFMGGGEPLSLASRTSSFVSLNSSTNDSSNLSNRTTIKIYAKCLRSDIEYKTLSISRTSTSAEVIWMLLSKFKMRHRDPKLFYLTMDIGVAALCRTLSLDEDSRPAELKSCHPWGECKFTLQMRRGGLVRIHDSVLMSESQYKSLLISENTTVREVITILFHCYGLERIERVDRYILCEIQSSGKFERRLHYDDCPASIQSSWDEPAANQFVLRRNNVLSLSVNLCSASPSNLSLSSPGSSTASSEISEMDTSLSSPSPSPDFSLRTSPLSKISEVRRSSKFEPSFTINGPVRSFHQVGLPSIQPPKKPKVQASLLLANGSRGVLNTNLRTKIHDYENYFYI